MIEGYRRSLGEGRLVHCCSKGKATVGLGYKEAQGRGGLQKVRCSLHTPTNTHGERAVWQEEECCKGLTKGEEQGASQ